MAVTVVIIIAVASLIVSTTEPAYSSGLTWIRANGRFCESVCRDAGRTAISAGRYSNNNNFYVCAANLNDGGRPGYNLLPNWSTTCTVGWGGREHSIGDYSCLCH